MVSISNFVKISIELQCTGNCTLGVGIQRRTVVCARGDGSAAGDDDCTAPRPHANRPCEPKCTVESSIPPDLTIGNNYFHFLTLKVVYLCPSPTCRIIEILL